MMKTAGWVAGIIVVAGVACGAVVYARPNDAIQIAALGLNYIRYARAPAGHLTTEMAPGQHSSPPPAASPASPSQADTGEDWPSYNRTLTSNRFSPLNQINTGNVAGLKVLCTYDTGQYAGFNSGLLKVDGALIFATEYDIFSIDPATCHQNWRTHEDYTPATPQPVNRGAAYLDGRLFRGTQDGRVLAYDAKTGKRLWATVIADPAKSESVPAAPIAWNGMVFVGNAGGDFKGVKGRMYALDAATGRIIWEFYLVPKAPSDIARGPQGASPLTNESWQNGANVPITGGATWTSYTLDPATGILYVPGGNPAPDFAAGLRPGENLYSGSVVMLDAKTGAYKDHIKIVPRDWHDWDVSSAPVLIETRGGRHIISVAPKDGHLYAFDLGNKNAAVYREPVTKVENVSVPFETGKPVHVCPGSIGGAEWNGPAYDPANNIVFTGEVDWCDTFKLKTNKQIEDTAIGATWSGEASINPFNTWGKPDKFGDFSGWLYATDADTGAWVWRAHTRYPIQSGVTPTAGGLVFFGDMGGNFYVVDAATGKQMWTTNMGGAIGGGVISYAVDHTQKIAVATGLTEILWPTQTTTAKVSVLGLK